MPDGKEGYAFYRVSADGEGKPGTKEPLRSDGQALCQRDAVAVPVLYL